jgi:photosystem II stability/assembly factor-like uncharacterized protein
MSDRIILGTRKGTIFVDKVGGRWKITNVAHAGVPISYAARDPRDGTIWAALDHGHWGCKLARSRDGGKTWEEAAQIKYPEGAKYIDGYEGEGDAKKAKIKDATLGKIWCLAFGGADQPGRIYAGTIPGGLFVSNDGGDTWKLNMPLWNHESRGGDLSKGAPKSQSFWFGGGATVDGDSAPGIHSVVVDPRNSKRILVGVSCAGVLESTDDGKTWTGRNKGLKATFLPNPDAEWGHDPHHLNISVANPDHVWQQNHCGVFYSDNGAKSWREVSKPENGVHFGFPVAVDENDGRQAWLVPGKSDQARMTIDGALFVAHTKDGGHTWQQQREGLPQERAHDVVYRHAFDKSGDSLALGSTTGNVYISDNRGEAWGTLSNNLPPVFSVRFASTEVIKPKAKFPARHPDTGSPTKAAPKKAKAKPAKKAAKKARKKAVKKSKPSPGRKAGGSKKKAPKAKKAAKKPMKKAEKKPAKKPAKKAIKKAMKKAMKKR